MSEAGPPARRESPGGVLGVGFGLVLIAALVLAVLGQRARSLDAQATFERWFEPTELPFALQPMDAARQAGGEILVRLADPQAPPETPRAELPEGLASEQPVDWAGLEEGPEDTPPTETLLVTWPLAVAAKQIETLFAPGSSSSAGSGGGGMLRGMPEVGGSGDPLAGLGPRGGKRVLRRGLLPWDELEAPFVLERSFEAGRTFVDTLRVNLSSERDPLVLFLRWPRGLPASEARATELLAALRRRLPLQGAGD